MASLIRNTLPVLFCFVPLSTAAAQSGWPGGWEPALVADNEVVWPFAPGDYERVRFADLTGNCVRDALVLVDGRAAMLYQPAIHSGVVQIDPAVTANDVDAVPALVCGGKGSVALVDANGLSLYSLAATGFVRTFGPDASWAGATLVHAADLDGQGPWDLIGVDATGATVLTMLDSGSGPTPAGSFTALGVVSDIVAPNWDGLGPKEIALLTTRGVEIRRGDGTFLEEFTGSTPGDALSVVNHDAPADELIWITTVSTGLQAILDLAPGGVRTNCGLLNGNGVVGAATADIETDRDFELVTTETSSHQALLFRNGKDGAPSAPPYSVPANGAIQAGPVSPAPQNETAPAFVDFTGDDIADFLFPAAATGSFLFFIGPNGPDVSPPHESPGTVAAWQCPTLDLNPNAKMVTVGLDLPENQGVYNAVQAILWTKGPTHLEPNGLHNGVFPISGSGACPLSDVDIAIPLPAEEECGFTTEYYLEVRRVEVDFVLQEILSTGQVIHAGFSDDETVVAAMASSSPSGTVIAYQNVIGCGEGTPSPGFVPLARIPPLAPDEIPDPGPITWH